MAGELDAGKPHVQFDEGAQETCDSATRLVVPYSTESPCGVRGGAPWRAAGPPVCFGLTPDQHANLGGKGDSSLH